MFARLCRNAGHEVCGDERPQHDGVLTGRDVRDEVSVKVDGNQYDWHLTHLQYTTYTAVHAQTQFLGRITAQNYLSRLENSC